MKRLLFMFCLLIIPVSLFAIEFKYILDDAIKFEEEIKWQEQEQKQAWEDSMFQETDSFVREFNLYTDDESQTGSILKNETFISVMFNGREITFEDVPRDTWFAPYVRSAAEQGIVSGYKDSYGVLLGIFGPNDNVSVEQLAKIAIEAGSVRLSECSTNLLNVSAKDSWSKQYISCAEELGWAIFSDGGIDVLKPATRSEVIVTILQAFYIPLNIATGEIFKDVTLSTQFSGAIEKAASDGIVSGYSDSDGNLLGTFGPSDFVTRAEVAKIITLAKDIYGK